MPIDDTLSGLRIDRRTFGSSLFGGSTPARLAAHVLAAASCMVTLAGCEHTASTAATRLTTNSAASARLASRPVVPLPERALLKRQPEPNCDYKPTEPGAAPDESNAEDRRKLDYERQCYRHAEAITRDRLQRLQNSVARTVKAVKRVETQLE
jgi:hypothetical protein